MSAYEYGIIGAALLDPERSRQTVEALEPEWFTEPRARRILEWVKGEVSQGRTPDIVTAEQALGSEYKQIWRDMTKDVASYSYNFDHYLGLIHSNFVNTNMRQSALAVSKGDDSRLDDLRHWLDENEKTRVGTEHFHSLSESVQTLVEQLEAGVSVGFNTGIPTLDDWLGGLRKGEMSVLGARPGQGKTALSINLMEGLTRAGKRCLYYSTEMRSDEVVGRMVAMRGIPAWMIRKRKVRRDLSAKLSEICRDIYDDKNIVINDEPRPSLAHIKRGASLYKGTDVIFVDYLTRCAMPKADRHDLAVTEYVAGLKNIARKNDCHVVCCSQLNRRVDRGEGSTKPVLSDLRDSGGIEQEADSVWLLSCDAPESDSFNLSIAKNRHGFMGNIALQYDRTHLRFTERGKQGE